MYGRVSNLDQMREHFERTTEQFKEIGLSTYAGTVMSVYMDWVSFELTLGTCESAVAAHSRMAEDFRHPDVYPSTRVEKSNEFSTMLAQAPRTCGLVLTPG